MLAKFVQQHSAPPPGREPIAVTYLVTGVSRDPNTDEKVRIPNYSIIVIVLCIMPQKVIGN